MTGTSSGIGAATRSLLERDGHRVIGVDLSGSDIDADLSTVDGRRRALDGLLELSGGRLDGFIPCAGVSGSDVSRIVKVNTEMGVAERRVTDFDHFVLRPLSGKTGELIVTALSSGSDFSNRLTRLNPGRTTVSLWVYPDSYDDLPSLKKRLREKGFQIATWPLQFGKLISGGPNGFRAASQ